MKDDLTYPMLSNQGNKPFSEFFRQKFLDRTKQYTLDIIWFGKYTKTP